MLVKPKYYGKYKSGMTLVVFRHDDGEKQWFENVMPIYDKYGITGTFAIITDLLDPTTESGQYLIQGFKAMELQGHEIASHTLSHCCSTQIAASQLANEYSNSKQKLVNLGFSRLETIEYPYGDYHNTVIAEAKKYYTNAGRVGGDVQIYPLSDYYQVPVCWEPKASLTVQSFKDVISPIIGQRKMTSVLLHDFYDDPTGIIVKDSPNWSYSLQKLEQICAWCAALDPTKVLFVTQRDAVRYMKGLGDYDYTVT